MLAPGRIESHDARGGAFLSRAGLRSVTSPFLGTMVTPRCPRSVSVLDLHRLFHRFRAALHMVGAAAAGACLVGPSWATLASSGPSQAVNPAQEVPFKVPVIGVKAFDNLGERGCFPMPPLHAGPSFAAGRLGDEGPLRRHVESAIWRCLDGLHGEIAVSVAVGPTGKIVNVVVDTADSGMRSCVIGQIVDDPPGAIQGPGTLNVTYFMARRP